MLDMEGNVFIQLFVDTATDFIQGFPMKKISEAAEMNYLGGFKFFEYRILKGIHNLELSVGKTVKRHHSDNAKEEHAKAVIRELYLKGTYVTSTAQNSSEQNAFVERSFASLFSATRVALAASGLPKTFWSVTCFIPLTRLTSFPSKSTSANSLPQTKRWLSETWRLIHFCHSGSTGSSWTRHPRNGS